MLASCSPLPVINHINVQVEPFNKQTGKFSWIWGQQLFSVFGYAKKKKGMIFLVWVNQRDKKVIPCLDLGFVEELVMEK